MSYPKYIPIEGTKFVRDMTTGAVINTDISEYQNYKIQKQLKQKEEMEKTELKNKVETMELDLREIKELLYSLLKREK